MRTKNNFKSRVLALFMTLIFGLVMTVPAMPVYAAAISITAPSALLFDVNANQFLYTKTPHLKRAPASTAKVLTAMVVMDTLPLNRVITIPRAATAAQPSKLYLKTGEKYYVRDLIPAILLNSANDAAEALAIAAGGSVTGFSRMMNQKARALGCKSSNFIRASGLPAKNQYSTAYDLALIMKHAESYPYIVQTLRKKNAVVYSLGGRRLNLKSHNKMLWKAPDKDVIGKTGWTRNARYCFVGRMEVANRRVLISLLGSHSLWRDVKKLVDYKFGTSFYPTHINKKLWARHEMISIQTALKNAGFNPGAVDGVFGPSTLRATQAFQKANGLDADGVVGTMTWNKLKRYL